MVRNLFTMYFGGDVPLEEKNINLAMMFYFNVMFASLIYGMVVSLPMLFFVVTLGVFFVTIIFHVYTVRFRMYNSGAFITSVLISAVELPVACYFDGRQICPAVVFYLMSFFFCIFCVEGKLMYLSAAVTTVSFVLSTFGMYELFYRDEPFDLGRVNIFGEVMIPLAICGVYACKAMDYRNRINEREEMNVAEGRKQAEEMSRSKELFLMNMSHEMRTPMNTIITATGLIGDKTQNSALRQNVVYLQNACNALVSNIDDLLLFSKAENSTMKLVNADFSTRILFEDIINIISVRLIESPVRFTITLDPQIPSVLNGDSAKIRQLFINILNNAVKYTREGYISLEVGFERLSDERILLKARIEDTGMGIRQEDIPRLFEAYEKFDDPEHETMKVEGTGLGLSICKSIIDLMDGKIDVESTYNKGTKFSFEVPLQVVDGSFMLIVENVKHISVLLYEEDDERSKTAQRALEDLGISFRTVKDDGSLKDELENAHYTHFISSMGHFESCMEHFGKIGPKYVVISDLEGSDRIPGNIDRLLRPVSALSIARYFNNEGYTKVNDLKRGFSCPEANVMIIDDNRTNLFVIERLLKRYGMKTVTAQRGQEALNLISDNRFDMIFIDYMMPEMDGIDTLKRIRENGKPWCREVPCIVLTADAADGARQMLLDAGFDDYISKPIQVERLAEAIYDQIDPSLIEWDGD
ncbi:MAG: response regulator [Lachnospiraceae bacterium]|nr:response regulator [Lachnospiraceae bacterium]